MFAFPLSIVDQKTIGGEMGGGQSQDLLGRKHDRKSFYSEACACTRSDSSI